MSHPERPRGLRAFLLPAVGYTLFVFYGCIVPLRFVWFSWPEAWARYAPIRTLHLGHLYRTDFAANVILFAPFAYLWAGAIGARLRDLAGIARSAAVWAASVLFVLALEFAQIYVPARSVSFYDVIAGSIGGGLGLLAWWISGGRVRDAIVRWGDARGREAVARWLLAPYLVFVFLYDLIPLDLTSSPQLIYAKWKLGRVRLIPFAHWHGASVGALWALGAETLLWVPVAALWTAGRGAPVVGWCLTVLLAMGVECLQLFVQSRVTDVTDVLCAALGGAIGVWIGSRVRSRRGAAAPRGARAPWLALVGFFAWGGLVAAASWYPFDFEASRAVVNPRYALLVSAPFRAYWTGTVQVAIDELVKNIALFLPLGALLAVAFARVKAPGARRVAAVASVAAIAAGAFVIEAVQVYLPSKTPDSADWLLATAGGAAGYALARALARRLTSPPESARD